MDFETVEFEPRPMIYLTRQSAMDPAAIGTAMGEMFATMGRFIGEKHVPVVGAPLAIYRDHANGHVTIDLGFPVSAAAVALAEGEFKAGETPSGRVIKAVHRGSYEGLRNTYGELEAHLTKAGIPMPPKSWEIYLNEPGTVADKDLITEIYMPLPADQPTTVAPTGSASPKFVHIDISADDPDRAAKFYEKVFGWQVQKLPGPVPYWLVATSSGSIGAGIGQRDRPWQSVAPTIEVSSADEYAGRIEQAGGSIVQPKTLMPGVGQLVAFKDTEGNVLMVLEPGGAVNPGPAETADPGKVY